MSTPLSSSQESQQDSPVPRPDRTMDSGDGFKAAAQSIRAASGIHERIASLSRSRVRRVTEYIQENLDRALTVSELAAVVCMAHITSHGFSRAAPACRLTNSWLGSGSRALSHCWRRSSIPSRRSR
jgi:hypothetical protein